MRAGLLLVTELPVVWQEVADRLHPFVARRVAACDVDDVMQDILLRIHRGVGSMRDADRFTGWMYRIARAAISEHGRARGRHPVAEANESHEPAEPEQPAADDRAAADALASCLDLFVGRLASPYREAVTVVELDGKTARAAAQSAEVSLSAMKSRVQRGRAQLRDLLDACCEIAVDARGKVTDFTPRGEPSCCPSPRR